MSRTSDLLVEPDWLEEHLNDSTVRLFDTSVDIIPRPPGPSDYVPRREEFMASHIPGATYLHMVEDLSDPAGSFPFAMPHPQAIHSKLAALGVRASDTIVVYGNEVHWATHRCWWVLAAAGANVRLLNGTFTTWIAEGRPTASHIATPPKATAGFSAAPHLDWIASREAVIASLKDAGTALINALSAEQFAGRGQPFGRPGRIPGSISVPAANLVERETGRFRPSDQLSAAFDAAGAQGYERLITYCGGGIAASTTFIALQTLGYDNVALYDGSLMDWASDPDLPMIVDA